MKTLRHSLLAVVLAAAALPFALPGAHAASGIAPDTPADAISHGEIRKLNKAAGTLTIKHGPLKNLGMEGMTMVFRTKDPAIFEEAKVGDRIDFVAEEPADELTVMQWVLQK